jgi:hypothetical protein
MGAPALCGAPDRVRSGREIGFSSPYGRGASSSCESVYDRFVFFFDFPIGSVWERKTWYSTWASSFAVFFLSLPQSIESARPRFPRLQQRRGSHAHKICYSDHEAMAAKLKILMTSNSSPIRLEIRSALPIKANLSTRTSKTEFVCKSYGLLKFAVENRQKTDGTVKIQTEFGMH